MLLAVGCHSMRPTLRLWPWSSFHGTVRFLNTPWGGISHTFTCRHTHDQWWNDTKYIYSGAATSGFRESKQIKFKLISNNRFRVVVREHKNGERVVFINPWWTNEKRAPSQPNISSFSFCVLKYVLSLSQVRAEECVEWLWHIPEGWKARQQNYLPAATCLYSRENKSPFRNVQTVASSEQEAMQKSLKGFHLMSITLPLWPDTLGWWGSTLPVWWINTQNSDLQHSSPVTSLLCLNL